MFLHCSAPMGSPGLLTEWIQPGAVMSVLLGLAGFFWAELKGLRAELKSIRAEFKEEIKASEARQNKRLDEFREDQNRRFDEVNEGIREIRALMMQQQNLPAAKA